MTTKELCDNYLSFLKDKNFRIDIVSNKNIDMILIVKGNSIVCVCVCVIEKYSL